MQCPGSTNRFEAVIFRRVVTARNHNRAVGREMHRRIVKDRSRNNADIEDGRTRVHQALDQRIMETLAAQPAVSAQADGCSAVANDIGRKPTTESLDIVVEELFIGYPTNIVFAENTLFEHKSQDTHD